MVDMAYVCKFMMSRLKSQVKARMFAISYWLCSL